MIPGLETTPYANRKQTYQEFRNRTFFPFVRTVLPDHQRPDDLCCPLGYLAYLYTGDPTIETFPAGYQASVILPISQTDAADFINDLAKPGTKQHDWLAEQLGIEEADR